MQKEVNNFLLIIENVKTRFVVSIYHKIGNEKLLECRDSFVKFRNALNWVDLQEEYINVYNKPCKIA